MPGPGGTQNDGIPAGAGGAPQESAAVQTAALVQSAIPERRGHGVPVASVGLQTFSSLKYRNYRYLFIGQLFSSSGQWIQQVTLSWLVYDLTGSALLLGAINGFRALPFLITGPLGGVAADRVDRRYLMMSTQFALAVSSLVLGFLVYADLIQVWHLFAFTLFTGVAWSFNQPVRQALVPSLVPKEDLLNAIALNSSAFNITRIIGPAIGGYLIDRVGIAGNFFIQTVAYLGVVGMIFMMALSLGIYYWLQRRTERWLK